MAAVASPSPNVCSMMTAQVVADGQSGRVFIARHGERADFADEAWLKQAEVTLIADSNQFHSCHSHASAARLLQAACLAISLMLAALPRSN